MLPILLIFAYLIGSISAAILTCKAMNLPDPRTQGSKNPGATNVLRIGGKKAAVITLLGDGLKGLIPVLVAQFFGCDLIVVAGVGLSAFLGHLYPVFFRFQGGKGVATFLGVLLGLNYLSALAFALTWFVVAKGLKLSSLSALVATLLTPLYVFIFIHNGQVVMVISLMCVWIFYTHRNNIRRLLSGKEGKI
jgi:glycerol-3-phosphate acyltransferase PlsY